MISNVFSQNITDSLAKKIDNLFAKWNTSNSPGCAVGIIRNDTIIYARAYGLANLEYVVPNTPETLFNTGSVSKQFTAYCIVLLARQEKLKVDEDIRTYLPWMPEFGKKITVRNLLNHTSGLRDYVGLAGISGIDVDGILTQDVVLNLIKKQTGLSFNPGEKFSYCNSNYVLLSEIVHAVSGQTFRAFADSAIFKPLGMLDSFFPDNHNLLIKNRAASYSGFRSPPYTNYFPNIYTTGDGGLFSNVKDMAKWVMNFYHPKVGDKHDIEQLTKKGRLNSGKELSYAAGVAVDSYKGFEEYTHSGANAGYTSNVTVVPELKLGFIVFSNMAAIFPSARVQELEDIFIKANGERIVSPSKIDTSLATLKNEKRVKNYAGDYISEDGTQFSFEIRNQKLYWVRYGRTDLLIPEETDSFFVAQNPSIKFVFGILGKTDTTLKQSTPNEENLAVKYSSVKAQTHKQLQAYTGKYYCPELDCVYSIVLNEKDIILRQSKIQDNKITFIGKDDLLTDFWWMRHLKMVRNINNGIVGFDVNVEGVMHLRFIKIQSQQ